MTCFFGLGRHDVEDDSMGCDQPDTIDLAAESSRIGGDGIPTSLSGPSLIWPGPIRSDTIRPDGFFVLCHVGCRAEL
jgi:hypothetical protein